MNSIGSTVGKKFPIGNAYSYTVKSIILSVYVDDIKLAGKKQNINPMWGKYSTKKLIWENQHHSLIMFTWVALKDNVKQTRISAGATEKITKL